MVFCIFFLSNHLSPYRVNNLNSQELLFPCHLSPPSTPTCFPVIPLEAMQMTWQAVLSLRLGSKPLTPGSLVNKHCPNSPRASDLPPFTSLLPPERPGSSITTGKHLPQSGPQFPHLWSEAQRGEPPTHKHTSLLTVHLHLPDSQKDGPSRGRRVGLVSDPKHGACTQ